MVLRVGSIAFERFVSEDYEHFVGVRNGFSGCRHRIRFFPYYYLPNQFCELPHIGEYVRPVVVVALNVHYHVTLRYSQRFVREVRQELLVVVERVVVVGVFVVTLPIVRRRRERYVEAFVSDGFQYLETVSKYDFSHCRLVMVSLPFFPESVPFPLFRVVRVAVRFPVFLPHLFLVFPVRVRVFLDETFQSFAVFDFQVRFLHFLELFPESFQLDEFRHFHFTRGYAFQVFRTPSSVTFR